MSLKVDVAAILAKGLLRHSRVTDVTRPAAPPESLESLRKALEVPGRESPDGATGSGGYDTREPEKGQA